MPADRFQALSRSGIGLAGFVPALGNAGDTILSFVKMLLGVGIGDF